MMIRLNKATRYALYAAMEMAASEAGGQVTAAGVAARYGIPATVQAKVFQRLVRAGIAVGLRGAGGGYRLVAPPSKVTLLDVIEALEPRLVDHACLLHGPESGNCRLHHGCNLRGLFDEIDELVRCTFASITLETLVGSPRPGMGTGELRVLRSSAG